MIVLHLPSWFPHPEKPLDGNFILRQIATVAPDTTSIVVHHIDTQFREECSRLLDPNIIFRPVFTQQGTSKIQMLRAYDYEVEKIIKKYGKPDLIHLHVSLPLAPIALFLSYRYHIPIVITEHWSLYQPQNRSQFSWKQKLLLKLLFHRAIHLTTVSNNLHQSIVETVRCARKVPYTRISNVVDTELFAPGEPTASEKKQILHISTLDDRAKNVSGILRCIEQLSKQRNDFELNIIHDLSNPVVADFIKTHQLQNIVHLWGKKTEQEVADAIRQSSFMLIFSNYETQSCVLLETFCCGKPAVATQVGGIPEIANDLNAKLVASKDEQQLVEQLNWMLDHTDDFSASAIRQQAENVCSVQRVGAQFLEVYKIILKKSIKAAPSPSSYRPM